MPNPDRRPHDPPDVLADATVDARLFSAIINLCNQFSACGLEPPVGIVVKPGQAKWIEFMVSQSVQMLHDDSRNLEQRGDLKDLGRLDRGGKDMTMIPSKRPQCFGVFRSPQHDAETDCSFCAFQHSCVVEYIGKTRVYTGGYQPTGPEPALGFIPPPMKSSAVGPNCTELFQAASKQQVATLADAIEALAYALVWGPNVNRNGMLGVIAKMRAAIPKDPEGDQGTGA